MGGCKESESQSAAPKPQGVPRWHSGKESARQCRRRKRCRFSPWVGKIPWSRKWQPTLAFLPGTLPWTEESGRLQIMGSQNAVQLGSQASTSVSRCIIMGGKETSIHLLFCYRQSKFPHFSGMTHHCPTKFLLCRIVQWALQDGGPVCWLLSLRLLSHMKSSSRKRVCLLFFLFLPTA